MDRVRNEEVRMSAGIERELASRADQRVSRLFGHVERRVLIAEVCVGLVLWSPRFGWMDGVKVALGTGMTVEAARQCGKEWRTLVHA